MLVPERVQRVRVERKLFRHEADLHNRAHAILQEPVIDLIDIGEVIDGIAVLVFVVYAYFVMKNGMKNNNNNLGVKKNGNNGMLL